MAQPPKPKRRSPDEIAASVLGGKPSRPPRTNQLDEYVRQQTGARRSPDEIAQSVLGRLPKPSLPSQIGAGIAGVLAMPQTIASQTVTNLMGIGKSEEEKRKLQARSEEFDAASAALTGMPSLRPRRKSLQQTFEVARGLASIPGEIVKYGALSMVPSVGLPAATALGAAEAAGGQAETSLPAMMSRAAGRLGMPRAEQALKRVSESAISRALFDVGSGAALAGGIKGVVGAARTAKQVGGLGDVKVSLDESAAIGTPRPMQVPLIVPSVADAMGLPGRPIPVSRRLPARSGLPEGATLTPSTGVGPNMDVPIAMPARTQVLLAPVTRQRALPPGPAQPIQQPASWRVEQLRRQGAPQSLIDAVRTVEAQQAAQAAQAATPAGVRSAKAAARAEEQAAASAKRAEELAAKRAARKAESEARKAAKAAETAAARAAAPRGRKAMATPEAPEAPRLEAIAPESVASKVAVDAAEVADRLHAIVYRDNTDAPILGKKATAASKEIDETLASLGDDDLFEVAKRSWDRFARARSGRDTAPQRANFLWSKVQKVFEDRFGASVEDYDQLMRQDKFDESWGRVPPSKVVQQLIESKADKDEIRRTIGELLNEWESLSLEQKQQGPGTGQIWPNVVERLQAIRTRAEMVMESEFKKGPEDATAINSPYDVSEEVWFSSGQALRAIEVAHNRLAGVSELAAKGRRKKKAAPPAPVVERPDVVAFGPQERVPVRYRIVDARSLVPSHSPSTFQPNPNYPKGVQGRNYDTDVAAQRNVESAAQNLDPDPLLDQTITPQSGAPVVTPSGVVVAGNQRSMIIARSIDTAPQRYAAYVQRLRQNAARYGLTADDFAGVERPVLVREMDEQAPEVLGTLNRLSDVTPTKAKSQLDEAASRFQALRAAPRPLQTLVEKLGDDETLNAFLDRADGQRFVRELVEDGVIAPQEMGRYLADVDRGILNEEGKSLVQRMVAMAAVEDPVVVSRAPASALQKLEGAVPHIVRASGDPEWSITSVVRDALAVLSEARDKGLRVADLLSQVSAFDAPIPPAVQRMALFLNSARPTAVKQAFRRYGTAASEARERAVSGATDMFGDAVENSEQVQARLFGQPRTDMAGAVGLGLGQAGAGATAGALTAEDDAAQQDVIDRMVLYGLMAGGTGMAGYRAYRAIRGQRPLAPPDPSVVTPAMQRVGETIFRGGQPRVGPTLRQRIVELPPRVKQALKTFRTDWVEESRPLIRAGREAAGATGQRQVQEQIAYAHGALGSAKQYLMDRLGPVLRDMSDDQLQAVGVLLKGRREADIRAIYGPHKADVDNATLAKAVADAEAQPAVKRAADEVNKLFADLLEMRHDAGLLTDEQYFRIVNSEGAYVAYIKELTDDIATGGPMGMLAGSQGGKFARATSGVRKMDRTKANIARTLDPLEAVAMAAAKTMQDVKKQQVASTVLDLVETANLPWIRRVKGDPTQPLGKHQFKQIRDGVLRIYEVEPEYADFVQAIAGQDAYSQAWYWRTMRAMKQLKTGGVTLEPTFQLFNVIRDTIMSGIQRADFARGMAESAIGGAIGGTTGAVYGDEPSDVLKGVAYGASVGLYARPLLNSLRAFGDIVGNRDIYQDFLRDGGSTEGFYVRNADDAHQFIQRMTKGRGVPNLLTPKGWYDVLSFIGGAGEQATRLAAYREAKEAGLSTGEAVMAAQDRTLRFSNRGGSQAAKNLASVTPFWNAKMQGWDKLARLLKDPKTYGAASVMITAPSVALWFENKDNPLYWQRPQWERNLFWLVPTPDKQEFVRIPKPFEIGFMFGSSFERMLDYAAQRGIITSAAPVMAEPERVLGRTIMDIVSTTGEGTIPVPPIISTPAQLLFDRDVFRNRRIVTRPDLPAELQAQPETSALARGAASTFGVAPEKVDFLLRDVGGTMGAEGARVLDMAARASGIPASEPSGGLPFFGRAELRFITQNRGQTESEVAARERLRRLERVDAGYKEVRKTGDPALLRQYILENRNDLLTLRQLRRPTATQRSLVRQLDDLQSMRRRVQQDKRFTADQRKDILGRIRLKSMQVADRINAMPPGGVAPSPR